MYVYIFKMSIPSVLLSLLGDCISVLGYSNISVKKYLIIMKYFSHQ